MEGLSPEELARERVYLLGIAYRMLASASDAEDVVQEALVRGASAPDLRSPRAFLTRVVTRLCLDELGSARRRRETYVGPDLPEPIPTDALESGGEQRESLSLAFLLVLERLTPLERAVFVLRDVFDLEFEEIGEAIGRSAAACRKLLSRAREHIAQADRLPAPPSADQQAIANAFFGALASGDLQQLVQLLADEATLQTDHGGKAIAARKTMHGSSAIARLLHGFVKKGREQRGEYSLAPCLLNAAPAMVVLGADGKVLATFTIEVADSPQGLRVRTVHVMRNPDKLVSVRHALEDGFRLPLTPQPSAAGRVAS